jgi:hypothetical protein
MKRYAFFYRDTCEYTIWTDSSYKDKWHIEERGFPKGTTDWEILEAARKGEKPRSLEDFQVASEHYFTRDLSLPPAE